MKSLILSIFIVLLSIYTYSQDISVDSIVFEPMYTAGTLPAPATVWNRTFEITDGITNFDCTAGGGGYRVYCQSTYNSWVAVPVMCTGCTFFVPASTTGGAALNIAIGSVPTNPNNGDIWTTTNDFNVRLNGVTAKMAAYNTSNVWSANQTYSKTPTSGSPYGILITGLPYAADSSPWFYFDSSTTTTEPTTWNSNGTMMGWNLPSSWQGNILDLHQNGGASIFKLDYAGNLTLNNINVNACNGCSSTLLETATTGYTPLYQTADILVGGTGLNWNTTYKTLQYITLQQQSPAPSNPSSGYNTLYFDTSNVPHCLTSSGSACLTYGTVTGITFSSPLSGGTINSSGTVGCSTCVTTPNGSFANSFNLMVSSSSSQNILPATGFTVLSNSFAIGASTVMDLSAATGQAAFKLPSNSSNSTNANGAMNFDTTANMIHGYINGADALMLAMASLPSTGHLIDTLVSSGNLLGHDSGLNTANIVTATSQGTGICHLTSGSQACSSSSIVSTDIANNTITATQIANNTITASQIANNTITATQIANNTITNSQIANATVGSAQIAAGGVSNSNLANSSTTVNGVTCTLGSTCNPYTSAAGTSVTLTPPYEIYICTSSCSVNVPAPAANYQFCVLNDDDASGVITLNAIGSSAMYEKTSRSGYGTPGTGTIYSAGAIGDAICIIYRDSTHYLTVSYNGTWNTT